MLKEKLSLILVSGGTTLILGCGSSDAPMSMVSGTVTLNGEPFTGASVHFYNPEIGGGAFNLSETGEFSSTQPLQVAEYLVSLDRPGPRPGDSPADTAWPQDNSGEVPARYRSSGKSGLVARVSKSDQNHFTFDIQGEPSSESGNGPTVIMTLPEYLN
jgi:hypothetical protein